LTALVIAPVPINGAVLAAAGASGSPARTEGELTLARLEPTNPRLWLCAVRRKFSPF
jgi:hypothetical protein